MPEEHCKYTKQSFSPCLCLSHITHPLLTHHTYYVVQRICFFFFKQTAADTWSNTLCFSTGCYKGFIFCSLLCFGDVKNVWLADWLYVQRKHILLYINEERFRMFFHRWQQFNEILCLHGHNLHEEKQTEQPKCLSCKKKQNPAAFK